MRHPVIVPASVTVQLRGVTKSVWYGWSPACLISSTAGICTPHTRRHDLVMAVADGSVTDVEKIATALVRWVI